MQRVQPSPPLFPYPTLFRSILFDEPPRLREKLAQQLTRGFKAIKMGWRPFGRVSRQLDELLIKTARDTVGADVELDRKSTRLNSSHLGISYAVFRLKKKQQH